MIRRIITGRCRACLVSALFGSLTIVLAACSSSSPTAAVGPASPVGPPAAAGPPLFDDLTAKTGINFTYRNDEEANNYAIIESVGGGVALLDFDRDGWLDIFLTGGGKYDGKNVLGNPCRLYRNLGNWKFEDMTEQTGITGPFPYTHGASAFDYDNDGWIDLLLSGYNRLLLLRNQSDGKGGRRFVDVTKVAGLTVALWSASTGWGDLDGDGFPEIYVCHYGDWGFDTNHPADCTYDGKTRDVCQPARFKPLAHTLYRNNRDGTFADVSKQLEVKKSGRGLGTLLVDVNADGRPDIYVANDTDDNFLFMNRGKSSEIKLEEAGRFLGVALDEKGRSNGSMGVDAADFDRSGKPSIVVTNYESELPALYQNRMTPGQELFSYATLTSGLAAVGGSYVSWGTGFLDYDFDGWEDLIIVSGHAIRFPHRTERRQRPQLLRNEEGRFKIFTDQGGPYFLTPHNARGAAFGDLDNDAKTDIVISHLNEPAAVLRNVAPTNGRHWLGIQLVGKNNRDIVGSRVVIETATGAQTRFVKGGGSFASTNDPRMVIGLGADTKIGKVTVHWSHGGSQEYTSLQENGYWKLVEGEATAQKVKVKKP